MAWTSSPSSRLGVLAEDDDADFRLLETEGQARDAIAQKSSISLSMTSPRPSTLATPSPISRMTPMFRLTAVGLCAGDLCLDVLYQVGHLYSVISLHPRSRFEFRQPSERLGPWTLPS